MKVRLMWHADAPQKAIATNSRLRMAWHIAGTWPHKVRSAYVSPDTVAHLGAGVCAANLEKMVRGLRPLC